MRPLVLLLAACAGEPVEPPPPVSAPPPDCTAEVHGLLADAEETLAQGLQQGAAGAAEEACRAVVAHLASGRCPEVRDRFEIRLIGGLCPGGPDLQDPRDQASLRWLRAQPAETLAAVLAERAASHRAGAGGGEVAQAEGHLVHHMVLDGFYSQRRAEHVQPAAQEAPLGLRPGAAVADIGSGLGILVPWLAEQVGPEGRVYSVDIDAALLEFQREAFADEPWRDRLTLVHSEPADVRLPEGGLDAVLVFDTAHVVWVHGEGAALQPLLQSIARSLRPGGVVVIQDYSPTLDQLRPVAEAAGLRVTRVLDQRWVREGFVAVRLEE